jgi:hypothetical protein
VPRATAAATDGTDDLKVTVAGSADVTGQPRAAYVRIVQDYASQVLKSAKDTEWLYRRGRKRAPEFNTEHFVQAETAVLGAGPRRLRPIPWWYIVIDVTQPILWTFAGLALAQMLTSDGWGWGLTLGIIAAVGGTSLLVQKLHSRMVNK